MMTTTINTITAKTTVTGPGNGNWVRHAKCPWSSLICNIYLYNLYNLQCVQFELQEQSWYLQFGDFLPSFVAERETSEGFSDGCSREI